MFVSGRGCGFMDVVGCVDVGVCWCGCGGVGVRVELRVCVWLCECEFGCGRMYVFV